MKTYHIRIEADGDWYVLQAEEDESIFSQARTLDEAVLMIRDVLDLMKGESDAELRLIIPAQLPVDDAKRSGRLTHPADAASPTPKRALSRRAARPGARRTARSA